MVGRPSSTAMPLSGEEVVQVLYDGIDVCSITCWCSGEGYVDDMSPSFNSIFRCSQQVAAVLVDAKVKGVWWASNVCHIAAGKLENVFTKPREGVERSICDLTKLGVF